MSIPARTGEELTMGRELPILLAQTVTLRSHDWTRDFEDDLRGRLAAYPQTRLVVYPELHLCPGTDKMAMDSLAEPIPGPRSKLLGELAADLGVWLVPGTVYERDPAGRIYNTAIAFSDRGELVARYRKCFPWRPWETTTPGDEFVVFDLSDVGRIGVSICYDSWFPEVARHLAWMGAEVILQPTFTPTADRAQELILSQAAAVANQVFVVSLNVAAPEATGRSSIIDPEGHVLLQAGEGPASLTHVLALDQVEAVRHYGTAGLNRLWSQLREDDAPIPLPLYGGELRPDRWAPNRRAAGA
jgi:predicted amidohydrolase